MALPQPHRNSKSYCWCITPSQPGSRWTGRNLSANYDEPSWSALSTRIKLLTHACPQRLAKHTEALAQSHAIPVSPTTTTHCSPLSMGAGPHAEHNKILVIWRINEAKYGRGPKRSTQQNTRRRIMLYSSIAIGTATVKVLEYVHVYSRTRIAIPVPVHVCSRVIKIPVRVPDGIACYLFGLLRNTGTQDPEKKLRRTRVHVYGYYVCMP